MGSAHHHFAFARTIAAGHRVVDPQFRARHRQPHGDIWRADGVGRHGGGGGAFGHAVAVLQRQAVEPLNLALPCGVQRRAAGGDIAQAWGLHRLQPLLFDELHHQRMHLGHGGQDGDALHHRPVQRFCRKAGVLAQGGSGAERGHDNRDQPDHMGERGHAIDNVPRHHAALLNRGFCAKAQVGMGEHHAFGITGGPCGVKQGGHVLQRRIGG